MAEHQSSIVLELQRLGSDGQASIAELLRKAFVVATKLKLEDIKEWIQNEQSGWGSKTIPEYRMVPAKLESFNPFHGWQGVAIMDVRLASIAIRALSAPVAQLEEIVKAQSPHAYLSIPPEALSFLHKCMSPGDSGYELRHTIAVSSIAGILEKVRFRILEWALQLEQEGILGEGMTFSDSEKQKAASSTTIHVHGDNRGVLGNVTAHNVQFGDYSAIHDQLKAAGVSQEDRNELENITDGLKKATGEEKQSLLKRGTEWLQKNGATLGALAAIVRGWFDSHNQTP